MRTGHGQPLLKHQEDQRAQQAGPRALPRRGSSLWVWGHWDGRGSGEDTPAGAAMHRVSLRRDALQSGRCGPVGGPLETPATQWHWAWATDGTRAIRHTPSKCFMTSVPVQAPPPSRSQRAQQEALAGRMRRITREAHAFTYPEGGQPQAWPCS